MSSDFNISEFRRRRASDNPPPPETGQLPFEMPATDPTRPQEYVPQATPAPMAASIPEAVPHPQAANPYVQQTYTPMAVSPEFIANPYAVQTASLSQNAVPLPMPLPKPETSKVQSKSLITGLLAKFKKKGPTETQLVTPSGPVEFQTSEMPQPVEKQAPKAAPLRAAVKAKISDIDVLTDIKTKSQVPTWAAFLLGLLCGVILTFAGLAMTAKTVDNSLEARFGEVAEIVQSAEIAAEEEVKENESASDPAI